MKTQDNKNFTAILFLPLSLVFAIAIIAPEMISSLSYKKPISLIPGIASLAKATQWELEGRAIWTSFWLSMPILLPLAIYIGMKQPAPIISRFKSLYTFVVILTCTAGFGWLFWNGVEPDPSGGRIWEIYQGSYVGFIATTYIVVAGFYIFVWTTAKALLMTLGLANFEKDI
ncbi:hypothetical protein [Pseudomonas sp. C9-3]|uniref:hypothetical protein n=1 Tax=Pseudomonas sp. C9-3 TaxID=3078264 RepID=UPI0028E5DED0|nr:hypothetical protein [Pseudomonas sp. C9-3]